MAQTVIVSNRLPVSVKKTGHGIELFPSSGGLATGLSSYANRPGSIWIGWPGIASDDLTEQDEREISKQLARHHCRPVFLSRAQVDAYYNGYSNAILWPFLHAMPADYAHEERYWRAYKDINRLFADAVAAYTDPRAAIWVHDYQLLLLPRLLREQRSGSNIGFFLHIPFPEAKHFKTINHAGSLLRGMLGADQVGFHTTAYAKNFVASCQELGTGTAVNGGLAFGSRVIRVQDYPMGIDYKKFARTSNSMAVQREANRLKRQYKGCKIILTVDRLDPTKGFLERLEAFDQLLADTPRLHSKIKMLMLAIPSREDIDAYRKLKQAVERKVHHINTAYGTADWEPIEYRYTSVSFEHLNALYRIADVAFVAPVKDGMNLVAKEFIASQQSKNGMLILSETAGAAQELQDALLVNPSKPRTLVSALRKAMRMPRKELRQRIGKMQRLLSRNTVHHWADTFMSTLQTPLPIERTQKLDAAAARVIRQDFSDAQDRLLLLDYDGVLVPFSKSPSDAKPSGRLIDLLSELAAIPRTTVAVVSGRTSDELETWFGHMPLVLAAEHGAFQKKPGKPWRTVAPADTSWKAILQPVLETYAKMTPGAFVQEKQYGLVWHYRAATPYYAQKHLVVLKQSLKPYLRAHGLKLYHGHKILEIKAAVTNKGLAAKELTKRPYDFVLAIGDDLTDEDLFAALARKAWTVKVGHGQTAARYRVSNDHYARNLLRKLGS